MEAEKIDQILQKIKNDFPDAVFSFREFKNDGQHYWLEIKSSKFQNLNLLAQHRLVYDSLKDYLGSGELHALRLKTSPL